MIILDAQGKADKCDLCEGDPYASATAFPGALKLVTLIAGEEVKDDATQLYG